MGQCDPGRQHQARMTHAGPPSRWRLSLAPERNPTVVRRGSYLPIQCSPNTSFGQAVGGRFDIVSQPAMSRLTVKPARPHHSSYDFR
jgi:hypothetical protein